MFNYTHLDDERVDFIEIASLSDLPNGERLFVEINQQPIVLFNIGGEIYAIGDICTHDDGPLGDGDLEAHHLVCPRHGAEFDLRTGKAMSMPAVVDIPAYPVQVREGILFVGMPKE